MRIKGKKAYYFGEFVLFSTILNRTIPGIILSEIVLSGDPLYTVISAIRHWYQTVLMQLSLLLGNFQAVVVQSFGNGWVVAEQLFGRSRIVVEQSQGIL